MGIPSFKTTTSQYYVHMLFIQGILALFGNKVNEKSAGRGKSEKQHSVYPDGSIYAACIVECLVKQRWWLLEHMPVKFAL